MNTLPALFEERIKSQLSGEAESFLKALQQPSPVSIRLNPGKIQSIGDFFPPEQLDGKVEWCAEGYYLKKRPVFTLDPGFHGGAYYVQEASSMFLQHILQQIKPQGPLKILDLCAAPGGKSTLIASQLSPDSLLVSNEIIRSRATILKENIIKWGQDNVIVTNNDPQDFAPFKGVFDIILVDAPCSGEGMFRKDEESIKEWSENNLHLCSERQQRILKNTWGCLKTGGYLIYSTCTFNPNENELMLEWAAREFQAKGIDIRHPFPTVTPSLSSLPCYHFYPHKTKGEGFFVGVLQKTTEEPHTFPRNKKQTDNRRTQLPPEIQTYIRQPELYTVYENEGIMGLLPKAQSEFIPGINKHLRVIYKGCEIAEVHNRKLKLLHPLALWQGLNRDNCETLELDHTTALKFLKKEDIPMSSFSGNWILITNRHIGLGWCKNLGNRLNNYYPKEWRIRMRTE